MERTGGKGRVRVEKSLSRQAGVGGCDGGLGWAGAMFRTGGALARHPLPFLARVASVYQPPGSAAPQSPDTSRQAITGSGVAKRDILLLLGAVWVVGLSGCNLWPFGDQTPRTLERIVSFEQVQGQWEGKADKLLPNRQEEGVIVLDIKPDGRYEFLDQHSTDPGLGSGKFAMLDGQLISETPDRSTMATLYVRDRVHVLDVVVELKKGRGEQYHFDMNRVIPGFSPLSPRSGPQ